MLAESAGKISDARDSLDGATDDDQGILGPDATMSNIVPTDSNGIAYSRTTGQVLNIVYLSKSALIGGGFFPSASTEISGRAPTAPELTPSSLGPFMAVRHMSRGPFFACGAIHAVARSRRSRAARRSTTKHWRITHASRSMTRDDGPDWA